MTDLIHLNDRQFFALKALAEETDAAPRPEGTGWKIPSRTTYAWRIGDCLQKALGGGARMHDAHGAANTLAALRRRKLVTNDGGGVFIQARWWITPAGVEQLKLRGVEL